MLDKHNLAAVRLDQCVADLEEQTDELLREWQVRIRCYDRWAEEGKMSRTDAADRLKRLGAAINTLQDAAAQLTHGTSSAKNG